MPVDPSVQNCTLQIIVCKIQAKLVSVTAGDVHYGTFRGSGVFRNLYFESRISNLVPE